MKNSKTTIPPKLRSELEIDPFYKVCALSVFSDHVCQGKINWEHAIIYAGKSVQKRWAIIPICEGAHNTDIYQDSKTMQKELHEWIALSRATEEDIKDMTGESAHRSTNNMLKAFSYLQLKTRLFRQYGPYSEARAIKAYKPAPAGPRVSESRSNSTAYILNKEQTKMIKECVDYYEGVLDMHFTPFLMLDKMIRAAYEALPKKVDNTRINYNPHGKE